MAASPSVRIMQGLGQCWLFLEQRLFQSHFHTAMPFSAVRIGLQIVSTLHRCDKFVTVTS
jgi:hypothetical protein